MIYALDTFLSMPRRRRIHVILLSAGLTLICFPMTKAFVPRQQMIPSMVLSTRQRQAIMPPILVKVKRGSSHARHNDRNRMQLAASLSDDRNDNDKDVDPNENRAGLLVLFTVPMAWGTFEPAVRYVYDVQPDVPPFLFQFLYYLIATSSLAAISGASILLSSSNKSDTEKENRVANTTQDELASKKSSIRGGFELGTYLFLGNAMQVVGLKTVASDRAAFLLQLTTIFVPLVQSIAARNLSILPSRTWIACLMALAGVAFIGLDGNTGENPEISPSLTDGVAFSQGDIYIILAALFYTFHCLRLEPYAKHTPALQLALAKASTETAWCGSIVVASLLATANPEIFIHNSVWDTAIDSGHDVLQYIHRFGQSLQDLNISSDKWIKLGFATSWIGIVTVGYTISAQSYGQARVPPATANLIYTIQPLFTAIIAFVILGETLGLAGYAGGLLIGSAVILVIQKP